MFRRFSAITALAKLILLFSVSLGFRPSLMRAQTGGDTGYGTCADGSQKSPGESCRDRLCNNGWAQAHGLGSECPNNSSGSGTFPTGPAAVGPPPPDPGDEQRIEEFRKQRREAEEYMQGQTEQRQRALDAQEADVERDKQELLKSLKGSNEDVAAECKVRAKAVAEFRDLKQRVETDQTVIRNFGFEQSADAIQQWANLGEQARQAYGEKAHSVVVGAALDVGVASLKSAITAAPALSQALSVQIRTLFDAAGIKGDDPVYAIITRGVGSKLSAEDAKRLNKRIDEVKNAYKRYSAAKEMATADAMPAANDLAIAQRLLGNAHALVSMAASFNPAFVPLAKDLDTVTLAIYGATYSVAKHEVEQLTTLTEKQLQDLTTATKRLNKDASELRQIAGFLKSVSPCDSTEFVIGSSARWGGVAMAAMKRGGRSCCTDVR